MGKKRIIEKAETGAVEGEKTPQARSVKKVRMSEGRIYIHSSYNNTIISLADEKGNVLFTMSSGRAGFKGTKKSTPFAASKVAEAVADMARSRGMERVKVFVKGIGSGRDSAFRTLGTKGLVFTAIEDLTPMTHNGPLARKLRRV
ncbi:MAG: 30S ribosomal protein S11, partial [Candidatus Pacearchaeota archaeon]|nr:30S ribosomal protein S11 [Candidatus Pacearchaeota archaeon]